MVPQRPFFMGNPGWVRCRAWIWLFSSTQRTMALSGGLRYSPTMSVSFSVKRVSFDSLNRLVRWGCNPWASQMRWTIEWLTPWALAIVRRLQWVAPAGDRESVVEG